MKFCRQLPAENTKRMCISIITKHRECFTNTGLCSQMYGILKTRKHKKCVCILVFSIHFQETQVTGLKLANSVMDRQTDGHEGSDPVNQPPYLGDIHETVADNIRSFSKQTSTSASQCYHNI